MLSFFNLKTNVTLEQFSVALRDFYGHMREIDLVESVGPLCGRDYKTPMDTDDERDQQYFFVTKFQNKAQSDNAYQYILEHQEPSNALHHELFEKICDPVFICYEEL